MAFISNIQHFLTGVDIDSLMREIESLKKEISSEKRKILQNRVFRATECFFI